MNKFTLKKGDKAKCPDTDCNNVYSLPVEDFSIPGRIGRASIATERCESCYALFSTMEISPGVFEVELLEKGDL